MEELKQLARELNEEVRGLQDEVEEVDRKRRNSNRLIAIALIVMFIITGLVGWVGYQVYDCTVPAGGCYQRNSENTGKAVADLQRIIVYSNECSVENYQNTSVIEKCVQDRLQAYNQAHQK